MADRMTWLFADREFGARIIGVLRAAGIPD